MKVSAREAWRLVYSKSAEPSKGRGRGSSTSATYHLVSVEGEPRILVDRRAWQWAMRLYRPTRRSRLIPWIGLTLLGRVGLAQHFLERMEVPDGYDRSFLEGFLETPIDGLSLLLGTRGTEQKLIAQIATQAGVHGYLKVADDHTGRSLLRNERSVLEAVGRRNSELAPTSHTYRERGSYTYLFTSTVSGRRAGSRIGRRHMECLVALRGPGTVSFEETDVFRRIARAAALHMGISQLLWRLREITTEMRFAEAIVHGDFAPWNIRRHGDTIRLIDWEYGAIRGLAGIDLLHFDANTALLLDHDSPAAIAERLVRPGAATWLAFGRTDSACRPDARALAAIAMLFDAATGCVASVGSISPTNRAKLEIATRVLDS